MFGYTIIIPVINFACFPEVWPEKVEVNRLWGKTPPPQKKKQQQKKTTTTTTNQPTNQPWPLSPQSPQKEPDIKNK